MRFLRPAPILTAAAALAFFTPPASSLAAPAGRPIVLDVDAREAPRRIFHARLTIPAAPGPLTLVLSQVDPGRARTHGAHHRPRRPEAVGRRQAAALAARRRRDVVLSLHGAGGRRPRRGRARLPLALPKPPASPRAPRPRRSSRSCRWNQVLLYPRTAVSDELTYTASLQLPAGWKFGTALEVNRRDGERIEFQPVSLTSLIDSPAAGRGAHAHRRAHRHRAEAPHPDRGRQRGRARYAPRARQTTPGARRRDGGPLRRPPLPPLRFSA